MDTGMVTRDGSQVRVSTGRGRVRIFLPVTFPWAGNGCVTESHQHRIRDTSRLNRDPHTVHTTMLTTTLRVFDSTMGVGRR